MKVKISYVNSPSYRRAHRRDDEESQIEKTIWALVTLAAGITIYLAWALLS